MSQTHKEPKSSAAVSAVVPEPVKSRLLLVSAKKDWNLSHTVRRMIERGLEVTEREEREQVA